MESIGAAAKRTCGEREREDHTFRGLATEQTTNKGEVSGKQQALMGKIIWGKPGLVVGSDFEKNMYQNT